MTHKKPLVSIITPSLNQGSFIEETILSVLDQDYEPIEYIVVDGGSTDNTVDILKKHQGRLSYTSEPDQGQSEAINKGLRKADGEIVAWLNSDDTYCPGAIRKVVDTFSKKPQVGIMYGDCLIIDKHGDVIRRMRLPQVDIKSLLEFQLIHQPAVFMRKDILGNIGFLKTDLHCLMDHDLWIRASSCYEFFHIPEYLACDRRHSQSKNTTMAARFGEEAVGILDRFFADSHHASAFGTHKTRAYAAAQLYGAFWLCLAGDGPAARPAIRRAMGLDIGSIFSPKRLLLSLPIMAEAFLGIKLIAPSRWLKHRWIQLLDHIEKKTKDHPSHSGSYKGGSD